MRLYEATGVGSLLLPYSNLTNLVLVSASLFWQGHLAVDTSYSFLVGAFVA